VFTGLIQGLGTIKPRGGDLWQISYLSQPQTIVQDLAYGDSIAVDGVCLTVEEILKDGFIATASPETLGRTTLGKEETQQRYVNLETSLRVGGKVGGHFVMGHVDGIGQLITSKQTASSWEMTFVAPDAIARYIVPKSRSREPCRAAQSASRLSRSLTWQGGGPKSSVDDLCTGRGVVLGRAATTLRSIETQPF